MFKSDVTTKEAVAQVKKFLEDRLFTGVESAERWENDGVHQIWCDQGKGVKPHTGWSLEVCGSDNEFFSSQVDFTMAGEENDEVVVASSWTELLELITNYTVIPAIANSLAKEALCQRNLRFERCQ